MTDQRPREDRADRLRPHDAADLRFARAELLQKTRQMHEQESGQAQHEVGDRGQHEQAREQR